MTSLKVAALTLAALLAAGCGSAATSPSALEASTRGAPTGSALTTTAGSASPGPSTSHASTSAPPPTPAAGTTRVAMQTAAGGEFLSPSGNISCEIDYHRAGLTQAYCQTLTPPRSVTMGVTGRYTTCTGQQCLGNPGTSTPTLAYGTATGVGPFVCQSASTGITCVAGGKGFLISTSGITPVSA